MKRFLTAALVAAAASCTTDNGAFTLTVSIKGDDAKYAQFVTSDTLMLKNFAADSADIFQFTATLENKVAAFKGSVDTPDYYYLYMGTGKGRPFAKVFIEGANMKMEIDLDSPEGERGLKSTVTGGAVQAVLDSLETIIDGIESEYPVNELIREYYTTTDSNVKDSIKQVFDVIDERTGEVKKNYTESHPLSHIALSDVIENLEKIGPDSAEVRFAEFKAAPEFAGNRRIAAAEKVVAKLKALKVGAKAPDFTQNDPDGNPVTLSEFIKENKVTMIDFWASWCSPCRKFNPTLTKIYEKYHSKGLGIIGVSLDSDKESWVKAIEQDKLLWKHVSDLKYWQNEAAELYYVRYIPQNVFVDANGVIIKRQAKEEEIEALLEEYLK